MRTLFALQQSGATRQIDRSQARRRSRLEPATQDTRIRSMNVHGVGVPLDLARSSGGRSESCDQTRLPYEFRTLELADWRDVVIAIASIALRGAPLIGVPPPYAIALAM